MRRGCALSVVALSIVAGAGGGCSTKWQARFAAPRHAAALEAHAPFIKAHLADGSVYVLQRWRIASGHLFGEGILYDADRRVRREGSHDVALARVVLLETNRPKDH